MTRQALGISVLTVPIAICISVGQAQTNSSTRIEENDKSITYTGNWYANGSPLNSGGSAALTNAIGATAVITFTGTGITWLGVLDPWAGMATVYLDGTRNTVDTYGSSTLYRQTLFSVRGLPSGPHTLSIEITHMRDANGLGSWVWIDAFEIENGSAVTGGVVAPAGRTEQSSPALTYIGVWLPNTSAMHSGGSAVLAIDPGSRVTVTFNGTGITWIAYRDEWSGIARVYVDGLLKDAVDTYLSPAQARTAAYAIKDLAPGTHTLTIEVTGKHSAGSLGAWIWVDAFDVTGADVQTGSGRPLGVSPPTGSGAAQTFIFTFSDPAGWRNMGAASVLINNVRDGRRACSATFAPSGPSAGSVSLMDDGGGAGGPAFAMPLPGSGSVSNSQCSIAAAGSSVSWSGDTLTVTLAIAFTPAFSGNKALFLASQDKSSSSTGWQALGAWQVPGSVTVGPAAGGVSPARSNTRAQTYTFTFTDTYGAGDIAVANVLINSAFDGRRACALAFIPSGPGAGKVVLVDDAGNTAGPYKEMAIPGAGSIANSQCSIAAAGSAATASGNALTLALAITFTPGFAGNQIFFLAARSNTLNSNWETMGTVTVP